MRVAIVSGASRGLGRALAEGLARSGWSLVVDGRDAPTLDRAVRAIRSARAGDVDVLGIPGDVTNADHRAALVEAASTLGELSLLVNNAGTLGASPLPTLAQYPLAELRVAFEANVMAPLGLIQVALPLLLESSRPRVVNITSDAAVEAYEGWGGYGAGKAALDRLSAVLAAEIPSLTVWAVDPGDLRTDMHQAAFPGDDISDRPEPATAVPAFLDLVDSDRPSGRYRASELVTAGAPS